MPFFLPALTHSPALLPAAVDEAITFIDMTLEKVAGNSEACVLVRSERATLLLRKAQGAGSADFAEVKQSLAETKELIDAIAGPEPIVSAYYYKAVFEFAKVRLGAVLLVGVVANHPPVLLAH